jgi:hypothetical protein
MSLLKDYLALCLFRNNPTDSYPSTQFMWKTIAFYLVSGMIMEGLIAEVEGVIEVWLRTIMAFSSISVLLFIVKKWQYFRQLFVAIFVCENFIITLIIFAEALNEWMARIHYEYREYVDISFATMLVFWYLAIVGYILRQMFRFKIGVSLMLAVSYFVLTYGIPMMFMDM